MCRQNIRKEIKMKHETEINNLIDEIEESFEDGENPIIEKFKPFYVRDSRSFNNPSYDEEEEEEKKSEAMKIALQRIYEDEEVFKEFILENEGIRNAVLELAYKICWEKL